MGAETDVRVGELLDRMRVYLYLSKRAPLYQLDGLKIVDGLCTIADFVRALSTLGFAFAEGEMEILIAHFRVANHIRVDDFLSNFGAGKEVPPREQLSARDVRAYGRLDHDGRFTVDLSAIRAEDFDGVMEGLLSAQFKALVFTGEALEQEKAKGRVARRGGERVFHLSESVANSALKCDKEAAVTKLAVTVARLLTRAGSVGSLVFQGLQFDDRALQVLAQAVGRARLLRSLAMDRCAVGDDGFGLLAAAIGDAGRGLRSWSVEHCGLSDASLRPLGKLVRAQAKTQHDAEVADKGVGMVTLTHYGLRGNRFTQEAVGKLEELARGSKGRVVFDLRYNHPRLEPIFSRAKQAAVLVGPISREDQEAALRKENEELWRQLATRFGPELPFAQYKDEIYAVGQRAGEFVRHVVELDRFYRERVKGESGGKKKGRRLLSLVRPAEEA